MAFSALRSPFLLQGVQGGEESSRPPALMGATFLPRGRGALSPQGRRPWSRGSEPLGKPGFQRGEGYDPLPALPSRGLGEA